MEGGFGDDLDGDKLREITRVRANTCETVQNLSDDETRCLVLLALAMILTAGFRAEESEVKGQVEQELKTATFIESLIYSQDLFFNHETLDFLTRLYSQGP